MKKKKFCCCSLEQGLIDISHSTMMVQETLEEREREKKKRFRINYLERMDDNIYNPKIMSTAIFQVNHNLVHSIVVIPALYLLSSRIAACL